MANLFTTEIGVEPAGDTAELQAQISGRAPELSLEQREKRKLAKRIIKAIQPALEDAIRKESELNRKPFEKELKELDVIFDHSVMSRRGDSVEPVEGDGKQPADTAVQEMEVDHAPVTQPEPQALPESEQPATAEDAMELDADGTQAANEQAQPATDELVPSGASGGEEPPTAVNGETEKTRPPVSQNRLPTPPLIYEDQQLPLAQGGVQWYMQPFDPIGTTIHEERWTGRDVMRGMSEELSELDEDELKNLVDEEMEKDTASAAADSGTANGVVVDEQPSKVHRTRRRWRGFK